MWRYRNAAHYVAGVITALAVTVSWVLVLAALAIFMAYELDEDWHLYDEAYHDILEFAIGFFAAVTGLIIWRFLT